MFLIDGPPPFVPGMCLVTKKGGDEKFVDLGNDFDYDHVGRMYVHWSAVRDMYRLLLTDPALGATLGESSKDRDLNEARERIAELEAVVAEKDRQLDAVYVLKNTGFAQQKKPGRKPSTKKEPVTSGS